MTEDGAPRAGLRAGATDDAAAADDAIGAADAARAMAAQGAVTEGEAIAEAPENLTGTAAFDAGTGDMPTWAELVEEHGDSVYRLAFRLTGNPHDAEDLTQETFMRVFRSLKKYKAGTFEGWLHRITTNLFLDMVRHRQAIRMEALPENYDRVPGTAPTPEQVYADANLDPDLERALAALHPDYRAAVVLCDVVGLTYEEIADTLGVKMGTVRSRIHRARTQLRANLEAAERERAEQERLARVV